MANTPITDDAMIKWAEEKVRLHPMKDGQPNSVERELASIMHQHAVECMCDYSPRELRAELSDLLLTGTTGYANMTRDQLLQAIKDELVKGWLTWDDDDCSAPIRQPASMEELPYFNYGQTA